MHTWLIRLLRVFRGVIDYAIVSLAFYVGYKLYFIGKPPIVADICPELAPTLYYIPAAGQHYVTIATGVGILTVIVYAFLGLYREDTSILHVKEYRNVMVGYVIGALLFLAVYYIWFAYLGRGIRGKLFSRRIFSYASALSMFGILCARAGFNKLQYWLHRKGIGARRVLIYGAGESGRLIARRLAEFPAFGMLAIGFVDDDAALTNTEIVYDTARELALPVLGTGEQLKLHAARSGADEVLVAIPSGGKEEVISIMNYCTSNNIAFRFIPNVYELAIQRTVTRDIAGIPMISVRETSRRYAYLACKRVFDFAVSLIVFAILSPFMLLIALIIRVDSKGHPVFVQTRIGMDGKPFDMFKFRTMRIDVGKYDINPLGPADERVTRVGRWLRRVSLDEIPQLINVLVGSMSLVGPRPEMPFLVEQYNDLQRERLRVKPGITGLWQISADRRIAIHENMDYDLYYVHEQSFLLDIVILIQTVVLAFRGI